LLLFLFFEIFFISVGVLYNINYGKLKFAQLVNKYRLVWTFLRF
jgi:hypothetical protein